MAPVALVPEGVGNAHGAFEVRSLNNREGAGQMPGPFVNLDMGSRSGFVASESAEQVNDL